MKKPIKRKGRKKPMPDKIHSVNPTKEEKKTKDEAPIGAVAPEPTKVPTAAASDEKIAKALVDLYRGLAVDVASFTAVEKKALLSQLDAQSQAERIYKHPDREAIRENLRKLLNT